MAKEVVLKHNSFVEANMPDFKELEHKIFIAFILKLQQNKNIAIFDITEIQELVGLSKDLNRFVEACNNLQKRIISLKIGDKIINRTLFPTIEIDLKEKTVKLFLHEELMPMLFDLKEKFTILKIEDIAKLESKYSIRTYELMMQYKSTGERICTVEFLRKVLDIPSNYPYHEIKRRVIEPSVKAINLNTSIEVSYTEKKEKAKTKSVTNILKFSIKEKRMEPTTSIKIAINTARTKNVNFSISCSKNKKTEQIFAELVKEFGETKVIIALERIGSVKKDRGEIKYLKAYLRAIIKNIDDIEPIVKKPKEQKKEDMTLFDDFDYVAKTDAEREYLERVKKIIDNAKNI